MGANSSYGKILRDRSASKIAKSVAASHLRSIGTRAKSARELLGEGKGRTSRPKSGVKIGQRKGKRKGR